MYISTKMILEKITDFFLISEYNAMQHLCLLDLNGIYYMLLLECAVRKF